MIYLFFLKKNASTDAIIIHTIFFQVFYSVLFIKKYNVFIVSIDSMWGGVNYNSRYLHHEISCDENKYSFYVLQKKKKQLAQVKGQPLPSFSDGFFLKCDGLIDNDYNHINITHSL